jgi:hypothetical protein
MPKDVPLLVLHFDLEAKVERESARNVFRKTPVGIHKMHMLCFTQHLLESS